MSGVGGTGHKTFLNFGNFEEKYVWRNVSGFFKCSAKSVTRFPDISCGDTAPLWKEVSGTALALSLQY